MRFLRPFRILAGIMRGGRWAQLPNPDSRCWAQAPMIQERAGVQGHGQDARATCQSGKTAEHD
jgi:hypothetical protein